MSTIFVTVDALRADHLGQYGYERNTMPVLDRLIEEGTLFRNAFSNAPFTHFSMPAIHTSNYIGNDAIGDRPTIASVLSDAGVATCTIGNHTGSRAVNHGLGFDEYHDFGEEYYQESGQLGADHTYPIRWIKQALESHPVLFRMAKAAYDLPFAIRSAFQSNTGFDPSIYASAADVTDKAIQWMKNNSDSEFFLWLHYLEGHRPYGLHDPDPHYSPKVSLEKNHQIWEIAGDRPDELPVSDYKLLVDMYDSNLRYCSRHLDRLFDALEGQQLWDSTNILFSSDHGEEFYDHGLFTHHNIPYDELIHVPLVVRTPGDEANVITEQRELLDVAPTIVDSFAVESPPSFAGRNLFEGPERRVIARGSWEFDRGLIAVRKDGVKYITTDQGEYLFDLEEDPLEEINIANERPDLCQEMSNSIPDGLRDSVPAEPDEPESERVKEHLEALGYR